MIVWHTSNLFYVLLTLKWIQKWILDPILDLIIGYKTRQGWRKERRERVYDTSQDTLKYERSAQVVRIWWRAAFTPAMPHHLVNFLYTHSAYIHPREVLKSKNITLHGVTADYVFFCVSDPQEDVFDVGKHPFAFAAQYLSAKRLIIVPQWAFNRLSETIEEEANLSSKGQVILIQHTGRCGSTLLCQMFSKLPYTRVLSEPYSLTSVHGLYTQKRIGKQDYERLVKNLLVLLIASEMGLGPNIKFKRIVIKAPPWCAPQMGLVGDRLPWIKQIFLTGHPERSVLSWHKVFMAPMFSVWRNVTKYGTDSFWRYFSPLPYDHILFDTFRNTFLRENNPDRKEEEKTPCCFGGGIACFLRFKDKLEYVLLYEKFLANPESELKNLFKALGLNNDDLHLATSVLGIDAQRGFYGEMGNKKIAQEFTEEKWQNVNGVFKRLGLPITVDMTLEKFNNLIRLKG